MSQYRVDPKSPIPRYYQIYTSLIDRIRSGEFPPGTALPAERQIADDYGVARLTVVKALDLLDHENLIERQQGRGNFVLDPTESALSETNTFAFLTSGMSHPHIFSIQTGIAQVALEHQCQLQIIGADINSSVNPEYLKMSIDNGVKGLIVYPHVGQNDVAIYEDLLKRDIPIVMVDRYLPELKTDAVVFDDENAAYQLTCTLISKGHQRIVVLPGAEMGVTSVWDRLAGYRRALEDHDLSYDEDLVWLDLYSSFRTIFLSVASEAYLKQFQQQIEQLNPTALLTINIDIAERVMMDLMTINAEQMRRVIEDNAQPVQYEIDLEIATFSHKQAVADGGYLTTVAVHSGETLGRHAAKLLLGRLNGTVTGEAQHIVVPMDVTPLR
ncbi:MAG: GntR family transcriptional regulator [Anaerolineales bacterium]|nr:GntR family transcriptional regulator [Anaerolineales bacterium]